MVGAELLNPKAANRPGEFCKYEKSKNKKNVYSYTMHKVREESERRGKGG